MLDVCYVAGGAGSAGAAVSFGSVQTRPRVYCQCQDSKPGFFGSPVWRYQPYVEALATIQSKILPEAFATSIAMPRP